MHTLHHSRRTYTLFALILGTLLASCQNGPTAPVSPTFKLSTGTVVFSNAAESEVTITNITSEPLEWRVLSSTASWVNGTPTGGSLGPNSSNTFVVRIDRRAVPSGIHTASLQIAAASYSASLEVRVEEGVPAKASLVPSTMSFSPDESTASVEIVNAGGADLTWSLSGPAWMDVTPRSGAIQPGGRSSVVVSVNRSNLTGGRYEGTLQLTSNGGSGATHVTMDVQEISGLRLVPWTLDFGGTATSFSLQVVNDGEQAVAWSASPGVPWVTLSQTSGNLPPHLGQKLTVEVTRSGLAHGTNQAPILFSTSRGSEAATVLVTVTPAESPPTSTPKPPKLSMTPVALDFGETSTVLNFRVHNEGDEALDWTAAPQASWISLPLLRGRVSPHSNAPVVVQVSRSQLPAGAHQSSIQFKSGTETITVVVMATVAASGSPTTPKPPSTPPTTPPSTPPTTPPAPAKIALSPTSLVYGTTATERTFLIQNTGGSALTWTGQTSSAWTILMTNSGNIPAGGSQTVAVRVSRTGLLAAGAYDSSVQISSNGGASNISISMEVAVSAPPPPPPPGESGTANVRDYGAYGDGSHDDTQAFVAALTALGSTGGNLVVPEGTYLLTPRTGVPDRGLDLSHRSNITVTGAGLDRTTLKIAPRSYVGSGDTHLVFMDESSRITIRDLALHGNKGSATFADEQNHCVEVWSSSDVLFERVLFHQCRGDGIRLMGAPSPGDPWTQRVTIQDSRFEDNGRSGIAVQRAVSDLRILRNSFLRISDQSVDIEPTGPLAGDSPTDVLIEGNTIRHSNYTYAIGIGGIGGGDVAKRLVFRNNRVENGSVLVYKAHDVIIENNVILGDNQHSAGLRLTHDMDNVTVQNNQITSLSQSEGAAGIQVVSLNDHYPRAITIRGNQISTKTNGILVRDALSGVTVEDNTITGSGGNTGILITNVMVLGTVRSNVTIHGNLLRNFSVGIGLNTQGDPFSAVNITQNDVNHNQVPSTATIGILFDKTGPYESFAVITPNVFGSGILTTVSSRS